ncbi:MAG: hypothetical protein EA424_17695 [Planctomycetaceae bacterium]|nr:MAG: hypothetical protein EA424_17695 [Planctomycetaceae bacterium]
MSDELWKKKNDVEDSHRLVDVDQQRQAPVVVDLRQQDAADLDGLVLPLSWARSFSVRTRSWDNWFRIFATYFLAS